MPETPTDEMIDRFFQWEKEVWKLVGCERAHYPGVEDGRHWSFCLSSLQIIYGRSGDDDNTYGGEIYGAAVFRGERYTIVVYDNGCGDRKCPILLDNTKAVSEWSED